MLDSRLEQLDACKLAELIEESNRNPHVGFVQENDERSTLGDALKGQYQLRDCKPKCFFAFTMSPSLLRSQDLSITKDKVERLSVRCTDDP